MSDKITKKELITNFRKLSVDNLINLMVLTDLCIDKTKQDSYYRHVMFESDSSFTEFFEFNAYLKLYVFGKNQFAHLLGVIDNDEE